MPDRGDASLRHPPFARAMSSSSTAGDYLMSTSELDS